MSYADMTHSQITASVEPYLIQVRALNPKVGWIDWMTCHTDNERLARAYLLVNGCEWAKPGKPYSRDWRVVPNPEYPVAILTVTPSGEVR